MQQAEEKAEKVLKDVRKDSVKNYEDFYEGLENSGYKNVVREHNSDADTSK